MLKVKLESLMKALMLPQVEVTTLPFQAPPLAATPKLLTHPPLLQDLVHLTPPSLPQAVALHTLLSPLM
jgi:hypothetical protein